ncbi:hypothetical protein CMO95_00200 [Candidatus Woesearchaeota archaeon]|nr:hypothetical protein [Candidatus Woesearchaeota archaeon]|tara:strand:+ start:641 stop:1429 length:789 start_codon:yes stop_codon:yes gene_type:complete
MPFIGNQPAEAYSAFQKQDFSTSATTSYTLDHPVSNQNEIALFINFVRQEPTAAYTASGTTLTLTSATSSSDDMYCVYLGKAVQTVNPPSGSVGISQLSATGTKDATTFLRGDNTFASAGGDNTPSFFVTLSGDQSIPDQTWTKITFDTETWDTDSAFASNKFTVPSGEAGKYYIAAKTALDSIDDNELAAISIYKNGSQIGTTQFEARSPGTNKAQFLVVNTILDLSASDYLEVYALHAEGGSINALSSRSYFGGYKLIGV